jgi:oligoendopeptidase F
MKKIEIANVESLLNLNWDAFQPAIRNCWLKRSARTRAGMACHWTQVTEWCDEMFNRFYAGTTTNTADKLIAERFQDYMENFYPQWQSAEQALKQKLIASGLTVAGFDIQLRNMKADADLFCEANLPLLAEEQQLNNEHDKIIGAQTLTWDGQERTARQMELVLRDNDRETRRRGWEAQAQRQLQDREAINRQWKQYVDLRLKLAANAGKPDYRAYRWQFFKRFDYSPADCKAFHNAIAEVVVPAVARITERRKRALGIDNLRYYDVFVDVTGKPPLRPFTDAGDLIRKASSVFHHVSPHFGGYFDTMAQNGLLDLDNRKNKANGAYCTNFAHARLPFIFANAVGIHEDVEAVMHEGGHSFHAFESFKLPYFQQINDVPNEFAEVASMGMEKLTSPYLSEKFGGLYSQQDAARAMSEHLENDLRFWPYMAIVDAFQHWVYENPREGREPANCDAKWAELEKRFRPEIDWSGYEDVMMTGWQRKDHIHLEPFYYVEYGLALLGAVQIWRNALEDQATAVARYRQALALGATAPLPQLFETAGAKLAFDAVTLKDAVDSMEKKIAELDDWMA